MPENNFIVLCYIENILCVRQYDNERYVSGNNKRNKKKNMEELEKRFKII